MYWIYVCIWYVYRGECKCVLYHLVVWVSLQAGLFVGWSFKTAAALTVWVLGSSLSGWWVGLNSKWDGNEWRNICPVPNKDHPQIGWVSIRSISIYPYFSCMCSEKIEKNLHHSFDSEPLGFLSETMLDVLTILARNVWVEKFWSALKSRPERPDQGRLWVC